MTKIKKYFLIAFKGLCMGIADIIPGVSGGTVAFLMGIYEELIEAIHSFDLNFLKNVIRGRITEALSGTGWKFLAALLCGILTAIFSLSHFLKWLLIQYPVYVHAFFFGLISATVFIIAQKIKKGDFAKMAVGLISAVAMYRLVGMVPLATPETWWFLFFSGAVAICAMILPGISGAFILLLLGKYEYIITAVSDRNLAVLIIVALGCIFGLLTFVRFLRLILTRYYDLTLSVLTGLVLGSLRKVWPWKEMVQSLKTSSGKIIPIEQINILPHGFSVQVLLAVLLFIAGICVSLVLANFDNQRNGK